MAKWSYSLTAALLLLTGTSASLAQTSSPCPPPETLLSNNDPVYHDAMQLAGVLRNHGFVVQCMFPSKLGSMFRVIDGTVLRSTIEGEAVYRTDAGDFEVLFVPRPRTFADFKVEERRVGSGYVYTLTGSPAVSNSRFEFARRQCFIKADNQLWIVDYDRRAKVGAILNREIN